MISSLHSLLSKFYTRPRRHFITPLMAEQTSDESASQANASNSESGERSPGNNRAGNDGEGVQQEKGDEERQQQTPAAVGFWDPSLKHVRHEAFRKWTLTTGFLMAFILCCLSIYWGVFTHVEDNLSTLHILIADFDGQVAPYSTSGETPIVGPTIKELARQMIQSSQPSLGYLERNAADFNYDPMQVRQDVYDFKAWGAIVINANATSMLYSAVRNGNTSYNPLGACQLVYVQARDDTNWGTFIYPRLVPFMTEATTMVGEQWTRMVMQNATSDTSLVRNAANVPQALSPAIGFSQYNLRPSSPYTTIPAVSVGLIYLIIVSFFSFSFYLPIHFKVRHRA